MPKIKNKSIQKPQPLQGWGIYLRTSNKDSQNPKTSKERQMRSIEKYLVQPSGLPILHVYSDTESGTDPQRSDYQRMLHDARLGCFSHLGVENVDRFGRDDAEALRAINELSAHNVQIQFADYPDIDPNDPNQRMMFTHLITMAQRESSRISERVKGGNLTKLLNGGHLGLAPDGYLNRHERLVGASIGFEGRTRTWIQKDPDRAPIWRLAWDLLITDQYSLAEICEELHQRGMTLRYGRPFVNHAAEPGQRPHAVSTLSVVFHNWFYAGYVTSEIYRISPKTLRGYWEPIVTVDELEEGIAILARRQGTRSPKRKHFYLLKKIAYVQLNDNLIRLSGSTPNVNRPNGGNRYYCVSGSKINIPCDIIDQQIESILSSITVRDEHLPTLQQAYQDELKRDTYNPSEEIAYLKRLLLEQDQKEKRLLVLYSDGMVSPEQWKQVWEDLQERRRVYQQRILLLESHRSTVVDNLEDALHLLRHLSSLYAKLSLDKQQLLLNQIIQKVVVDVKGTVLWLELHPPFAYLAQTYGAVKKTLEVEQDHSPISIRSGLESDEICSRYVLKGQLTSTRTLEK